MDHLVRLNTEAKLAFENIYARDFSQRFPQIDLQAADLVLHGQLQSGEMIYGLEVTYQAWALVGKRHWVAILRWPVVKQVSHQVYLFFAKHRSRISKLLTGSERCEVCEIKRGEV